MRLEVGVHPLAVDALVRVDGREVRNALMADTVTGEVRCFQSGADGKIVVHTDDISGDGYKQIEILYGKVELSFDKGATWYTGTDADAAAVKASTDRFR